MISPSSIFNVLKGIPFSSNYTHTILFTSKSAQETYMLSKVFQSFTKFTYVRHRNSVHVPGNADLYYGANYCMFKNSGYSNKWFYAFITSVNYVNDNTTELVIELDLLQSWMFDFSIGRCFVDREHVADDTVGKHTIPENIPFGPLVGVNQIQYGQTPVCVVQYATGGAKRVDFVNNVYAPLATKYGANGSEIYPIIESLADTPEKIALLKMGFEPKQNVQLQVSRELNGFTFGGETYVPVNNKLYCFPYCCLYVDDYGSNTENFKWEDFADPTAVSFGMSSYIEPYPISAMVPNYYKGINYSTHYAIVKTDFPDVPYVIDNFRAWASSVGAKQSLSEANAVEQSVYADIGGAVSILSAGASGNPKNIIGATSAATTDYLSRQANLETQKQSNAIDREYAKTHGASIGGQYGGTSAMWVDGRIGWRFIDQRIKPEYARVIDGYFTRFGYKVNEYKVPSLKTRQNFNYLKTISANVEGDCPDYALSGIAQIFDAGITLWHNYNVGQYSLENKGIGG